MTPTTNTTTTRGFPSARSRTARARDCCLIRHGECVANADGLAGGPIGDGGLTDARPQSGEALAERLAMTNELSHASAFYTSTLPRTIETGRVVFPAINPDLEPVRDEALASSPWARPTA